MHSHTHYILSWEPIAIQSVFHILGLSAHVRVDTGKVGRRMWTFVLQGVSGILAEPSPRLDRHLSVVICRHVLYPRHLSVL